MKKSARNSIYKILIFAVAILFAFVPVNGGNEIGTQLMINAIGIDGGENITATIESVGKKNESLVGTGATLKLAFNDINEKEGLYAELAHCGLIVLGKDLQTEQALECLMTLLSDGKINAGCSVITCDTSARDFMDKAIMLEGNGGVGEYITYVDQYVQLLIEKMITFTNKVRSRSGAAYLPIINAVEKEGESGGGTSPNTSEGGGAQPKPDSDKKSEMILTHKSRAYGAKEIEIGETETRALDWLNNNTGTGVASIKNFSFAGRDYGVLSVEMSKKSGSLKIIDGSRAEISISATMHADNREKMIAALIDSQSRSAELIAVLRAEFEKQIRSDAQSLIDFCKAESIDLLGLCNEMYKYRPRDVKSIEEMLSAVDVSIKTDITVY